MDAWAKEMLAVVKTVSPDLAKDLVASMDQPVAISKADITKLLAAFKAAKYKVAKNYTGWDIQSLTDATAGLAIDTQDAEADEEVIMFYKD